MSQKHQSDDRETSRAFIEAAAHELCRFAREYRSRPGDNAPSTEWIAELYDKLTNGFAVASQDESRRTLCASAMRKLVVEHMRRVDADDDPAARTEAAPYADALAIDTALESVERINPRLARVVECRYFARMSEAETAAALKVPAHEVARDWRRARAWLLRELTADAAGASAVANATWVDAVFDDALALPAERLGGFLERCAAAPGGLRTHVEELLELAADSGPRLSPGDLAPELLWLVLTSGNTAPPVEPEGLDLPIAAVQVPVHHTGWRIVRQRGDGRLGPVYLAERKGARGEQKGTLRYVPRSVAADLAALRARPDYRAVSSLRHEGIARLLDAGEAEDGRLFVVSEYVDGRPIDRYCDEERLSIDQRLELFSRVCAAVQYAHRQVAVHAAIEPSNVVVTNDRQVRLLAFGMSGLVLPPADATGAGSLDGIPSLAFASPEQVRGEPVAVASDVYQLGLLLYLLLTGEPAQTVSHPTRLSLEHAVCRTTPILPSARAAMATEKTAAARRLRRQPFARALRGDLDAILMYALRKPPERRYPSVSLLRSDVERYRKRLPVWAQRDTPWYRLRKLVTRRRAAVAAALLIVMLGAVIVPGRIVERAKSSRESARVAEAEQLLARLFPASDSQIAGEAPNAFQYVEQAVTIARTQLAGEPKSQARLFTAIGRAYASLGHYQRSIDILEEALGLRRAAFGGDSLEVADTLGALGEARYQFGRYDEAETNFRTALAVRTVREGTRTPGALAASVGLSEVLHARGQFEAAEAILRQTIAVLSPEPIDPDEAMGVDLRSRALQALANVLRDRGVLGESAALYREGISLLRSRDPERSSRIAGVQVDLARLLILRAELDRAEFELVQAISTFRRQQAGSHPALGTALRDQALLRMEQGRLDEAQVLLGEAERLQEQLFGRVNPSMPRIRAVQAELARRRGDLPQAVMVATDALEALGGLNMSDHPCTVEIRSTLAQSLMVQGEFHQATRVLGQALTVAERAFVSYDPRISRLQTALGRAAGTRAIVAAADADGRW